MGFIGGEIGYRVLKWYTRNGLWDAMDGSAYAGKSKVRVLLGDDIIASMQGKDVIDFGCGAGTESIELAQAGARSVVGVDLLTHRFPDAERRARDAGVSDRVRFVTTPDAPADVVVSLDSFEHFDRPDEILRIMATFLRPGGRVVASFGPTWYHPLGGHLFSVFPWSHLIFTEKALIRWRSGIRSDGATRFSESEGGLNQMTICRFERLVNESPFRIVHLQAVPIRPLRPIANTFTREFTTAIVRCTLELP
jgi:SAM-dependent methyltransferase